jgi:hypothetical protein
MRRLLLCALASACYEPIVPEGAPCDDASPCPTEQTCVAMHCRYALPASDSGAPGDLDNDGVPDDIDNCPTVPNPDQANEDGDRFGDACDPCPIDSDDNPVDSDGDGVADPCDPHPETPGDQIVLFEGFHNGVPTSWQVIGQATQAGDDIEAVAAAGNHAALVPPVVSAQNMTVTTLLVIESSTVGNNLESWASIVAPYDPSADTGIWCEIFNPATNEPLQKDVDIFDGIGMAAKGSNNFDWQLDTPYQLVWTKTGGDYTCNVVGETSASGSTNDTPTRQAIALHNFSSTVKYSYMMIVTSP